MNRLTAKPKREAKPQVPNRPGDYTFRPSVPREPGDYSPVRKRRQVFNGNVTAQSVIDPYRTGDEYGREDFCVVVGADSTLYRGESFRQRGEGFYIWNAEERMDQLRGKAPDPGFDEMIEAWSSPAPPEHLTRRPPQESLMTALDRVRHGIIHRPVSLRPRLVKTPPPLAGTPLPPMDAETGPAKRNQTRRPKRRVPRKAQKYNRLRIGN